MNSPTSLAPDVQAVPAATRAHEPSRPPLEVDTVHISSAALEAAEKAHQAETAVVKPPVAAVTQSN